MGDLSGGSQPGVFGGVPAAALEPVRRVPGLAGAGGPGWAFLGSDPYPVSVSGAGRIREFRTNQLEDLRDALDFLLYDTITLESRFAECAASGGSYHLRGFGKEFVSYLLCLRDPSLFGIWQSYVPRALRLMDKCPPNLGKGHLGLGYLDLLDALQGVRQETGLADFRGVDEYCFAVTRRYEPLI